MKLSTLTLRFILVILFLFILPSSIQAGPYFYISGPDKIYPNNSWQYSLYLYTDGSVVTAAQGVVNFDNSIIEGLTIGNSSSVCKIWAPADPSLGYGTNSTPYFKDGNKIVASCGFPQGYVSGTGQGGLVLKFNVTPKQSLTTTKSTSLSIGDTKFLYIGSQINSGNSPATTLVAYESTTAAYIAPTPTPTPVVTVDTLNNSELEFVNLASGSSRTTTRRTTPGQADSPEIRELELLEQEQLRQANAINAVDNSIPPPPANLEKRAPITPMPTPLTPEQKNEALGEVLSIQSIRELLLPGKSSADQKVVWINLVTTLTFLVIMTILLWRLITVSRMNKIKTRHMKELLTGELSVLESKLSSGDTHIDEAEFSQSLDRLREDLEKS
jgi:hypothetical protein